ncbi:protein Daple-like [Myotis daubentonii]|uniref:protein Daple-like n=1 Tax=Myotis daubentonii TaxID=98922 RepID=UPI002873996A|nr:protein Daple-like [Myotis daubentonii]
MERGCLPRDWKGPWRRVGWEEGLGSGLEGTRVHPRRAQLCREKPLPEAVQSPVCGCLAGVSLLREQDQRQHEESLQELGKLLHTQREALKQEQEVNALAAQEWERLRQELDREEEDTVLDAYEPKDPAPRKKKRWIGARAVIRLFKHKSTREPAELTPDRPPGPLEATPSCSYRMEERDTPSVPVGKDNNVAARHKKKKRKKTDKSPAARPSMWKRLQCWSSSDIPPPSK